MGFKFLHLNYEIESLCIFTSKIFYMRLIFKQCLLCSILILFSFAVLAQFRAKEINWTPDGESMLTLEKGNIVKTTLKTGNKEIIVNASDLTPQDKSDPLRFNIYSFTPDYSKLLIFTNTAKVWRYNTRGDYWILNLTTHKLNPVSYTHLTLPTT